MIPPAPLKHVGNRFVLFRYCVLCTQPLTLRCGDGKEPMKGNIFIGSLLVGVLLGSARIERETVELPRTFVELLPAEHALPLGIASCSKGNVGVLRA